MVYDAALAARVRSAVAEHAPAQEKAMFGGLAFMVEDHMACGMMGDDLLVRVGTDGHDDALARGAREMDVTGRTMRGFVVVPGTDLADDEVLDRWVAQSVRYASQLPPKKPKAPKKPRRPRGGITP